MSSKSLLWRLEFPDSAAGRSLPGDTEEVKGSIRRHLQQMLNTRHGNSPTVPDFGTSDFSDFFRGNESIQRFREEIAHSIRTYERRLTDIEVSFVPKEDEPFRLHFDISATIIHEGQRSPTVFRTVVEGTGKVQVGRG
jgi:type VI secretion system lysozyme-like protein